jgi:hypothetical protein
VARISYDEAYPAIELLPRSHNWWAWLKGTPPECIHLGEECDWIATLLPDTLYLRGKRSTKRDPPRPEITLCRECLNDAIAAELESFPGRVVAFEPDAEIFTQYFFVAQPDFAPVGLRPEVSEAIGKRLTQRGCGSRTSRSQAWMKWSKLPLRRESRFAHGTARAICSPRSSASRKLMFST